jgi:hypothetical protein
MAPLSAALPDPLWSPLYPCLLVDISLVAAELLEKMKATFIGVLEINKNL